MFKKIVGAVMAAVMMAAVTVTGFASDFYEYVDDDCYFAVDEDGNGAYYDYRRNSVTYFDEDGSYMEVDRHGNTTYYDSDDDLTYYISGDYYNSGRSSRRSSSGRSSSRSSSRQNNTSSGWINNNGTWKYKRPNGTYASNCWEQVNGKWYSFDGNGNMRANQWIRHTTNEHLWYYVGSDGAMVKNTTIGGYFINANGECYC